MSIPKDIRYDLARAEGYLQKNDVPMALESVAMALRHISSQHISSVSIVEKHINAMLARIVAHPSLQALLGNDNAATVIEYQYAKEGALATVLREFAKILRDQSQKKEEYHEKRERLQDLLQKGLSLIEEGQVGTGASFLQRAAKEYGHEAHTIVSIGQALVHYEQYHTAAKVYHDSIAQHPKNKEFYSQAIKAYVHAEDFAGAIHVFHRALQQFGRHPRSVAKLAELYLLWDKEEEAELLAKEALEMDEHEGLAQEILHAVEERIEAREMEALALEEERQREERLQQALAAKQAEQEALEKAQEEMLSLNAPASTAATAMQKYEALVHNGQERQEEQNELEGQDEQESTLPPAPPTEKEMVQGLAQDVLLSFQDVGEKKR